MKTNMQVKTLMSLIETQRASLSLQAEHSIQNSLNSALSRANYQ